MRRAAQPKVVRPQRRLARLPPAPGWGTAARVPKAAAPPGVPPTAKPPKPPPERSGACRPFPHARHAACRERKSATPSSRHPIASLLRRPPNLPPAPGWGTAARVPKAATPPGVPPTAKPPKPPPERSGACRPFPHARHAACRERKSATPSPRHSVLPLPRRSVAPSPRRLPKTPQAAGPCSWACRRVCALPPEQKRNEAPKPPARGAWVREYGANGTGRRPCRPPCSWGGCASTSSQRHWPAALPPSPGEG